MAEFLEVMRQWKRRCEHCDAKENVRCYVHGYTCSAFNKMKNYTNFQSVEKEIMQWAAEHPEHVYPTWGEWFVSRGMLPEKWDDLTSAYMDVGCVPNLIHSPIPADIAQKLEIEPKEG